MPTPPGITKERAEKLLDLIEAESALDESQFKGLQISTTPFTNADRRQGKAIFLGRGYHISHHKPRITDLS